MWKGPGVSSVTGPLPMCSSNSCGGGGFAGVRDGGSASPQDGRCSARVRCCVERPAGLSWEAACWGAARSLPEEPAASLSGTPSSPPEVLSVDLAHRMGEHVQLRPLCLRPSLGPLWVLRPGPCRCFRARRRHWTLSLGLQHPEKVPPNTACPDLWQHPNYSWGGGAGLALALGAPCELMHVTACNRQ